MKKLSFVPSHHRLIERGPNKGSYLQAPVVGTREPYTLVPAILEEAKKIADEGFSLVVLDVETSPKPWLKDIAT